MEANRLVGASAKTDLSWSAGTCVGKLGHVHTIDVHLVPNDNESVFFDLHGKPCVGSCVGERTLESLKLESLVRVASQPFQTNRLIVEGFAVKAFTEMRPTNDSAPLRRTFWSLAHLCDIKFFPMINQHFLAEVIPGKASFHLRIGHWAISTPRVDAEIRSVASAPTWLGTCLGALDASVATSFSNLAQLAASCVSLWRISGVSMWIDEKSWDLIWTSLDMWIQLTIFHFV
jgi:hypothetical protein